MKMWIQMYCERAKTLRKGLCVDEKLGKHFNSTGWVICCWHFPGGHFTVALYSVYGYQGNMCCWPQNWALNGTWLYWNCNHGSKGDSLVYKHYKGTTERLVPVTVAMCEGSGDNPKVTEDRMTATMVFYLMVLAIMETGYVAWPS